MNQEMSFGAYVRQRRREMDLTQEELARRVGCAAITLRKIEADDLRASVQIAERLAMALAIPLEERAEFVRRARAVRPESSELPHVTPPPSMEEIGREDLTGRAIRGYALAERIGTGGMGSVYRAVQPNVEREVAVKIILPAFANHPDFIRRFEAEAQLVARLEHPHIVPLYDYWREPGVAYLVMRLLRGGNIQNILTQGPMPIDTTAHMLEQICSALNAAHRIGVIHRDLKPANVLLDEDSNAYLADFGIAKNLGDPDFENQTQVDVMIGSPQYMSPEQIRSLSIRPQTDVYCLGVMLYEMLTGSVPFSGPTPFDLIQQHINTPMPPLSAHKSGLPAALDAVITRATAKDPEERYADALSLFQDFRQAIGRMVDTHTTAIAYEEEDTDLELANPFKGLRAFSEADVENFFGRETLVQQLLARLGEGGDLSRFLAVIGPSGSGKSSVVRAGLIPALRRGGLPGSENWFVVDMLPGKHPFEELEAALLRVAVNPPQSLLSQLKDGNRGLLRAVHRILPADETVELVLVIDQFEEVFTLVEDEAERALLLESIATAVMDERSRLHVIITLRADFTDKPLRYVDFGEMMNRRFEFILPLTGDEVERAIAGPAQRVGLRLEKGLVSTIIREAGNQPGTLPLLQHALSELFEKREGRTLTNKAYREIGGVLGALVRSAEVIYALLNEPGQSATRQLFLRLVTLGEGTEDTRRRVLQEELGNLLEHHAPLSEVIAAFGRARLLSFDRDPITRGATIEVAHESLLREWTRLRDWLSESRADVRLQRQLATAAREWENAKQDTSFLLTGARLEQFEGWVENTTIALTQNERAYLDSGMSERDRRESDERMRAQRELENARKLAETERRRAEEQSHSAKNLRLRNRVITAVGSIAIILALIAGTFSVRSNQNALTAQNNATTAQAAREEALNAESIAETERDRADESAALSLSRELAAAAIINLNADPERSILLALEALNTSYTVEAEDALHRAVQASRIELVIQANEADIPWNVEISPDGKYILAGGAGDAKLFDAKTGELMFQVPGNFAVFNPDGKQFATSGESIRFWDTYTGEEIITSSQIRYNGINFQYSPDGNRILTSAFDGTPIIWDAATGEELVRLVGHTGGALFTYFSPDGTRVLSFGDDITARVWDAFTGDLLLVLTDADNGFAGAFSPDSKRIATVGGLGFANIYIWDAATGEKLSTIFAHTDEIFHVEFSPDGLTIASSSKDRTAKVFDVATGQEILSLSGHTASLVEVDYSLDGTRLVTNSFDGTARVWDLSCRCESLSFYAPPDSYGQFSYNSNGEVFAMTGENESVRVWDMRSGDEIQSLPNPGMRMNDLDISPDGSKVAIAFNEPMVRIWDVASGSIVETITAHTAPVYGVTFNADGTRLVTVSEDQQAILWDVTTSPPKELFTSYQIDAVTAVAFSPDDKLLALGVRDLTVQMLDAENGELIQVLRGHTGILWSISFSLDGSRIATSSEDGTAKIWELASGSELLTLRGHASTVFSVAFSPDGKRIATASNDTTAKLWDASTGQELLTFPGNGWARFEIGFSPDGKFLAVGGPTGIHIYLMQLDDLVALAHSRLTRELTSNECVKYLHKDRSECVPAVAAPTATPIPPTNTGRVCQVVSTDGLFDEFNAPVFEGLKRSGVRFGWDVQVLESTSIPDYRNNIAYFEQSDCDLIVGVAQLEDAVRVAAEQNPNQKFLLVEDVFDPPFDNVWTQIYVTDQAAFLAGYLAASQTKTGKVGVFGGIDVLPVTVFMDGFALGVQYYNEKNRTNVETLGWDPASREGLFVGGFCCALEGKQITQQLLDEGADIILPVAGREVGIGAIEAIQIHGNAYFIGVDFDWASAFPEFQEKILTSILKNYDATPETVVQAIVESTFTGGTHFGGLETGEVGLAPFYNFESQISAEIKAELEQIKTDIISGKIQTKP